MPNDYAVKSKGIIKTSSTGIYPSIEALFGPWNSFEEFRTYLGSIILKTVTDSDIPNGLEIGIKQSNNTLKRYKWTNPNNADASWVLSDAVESVNGKTGAIILSKSDIGLGNVENTTDANKNVNSAVKDGSGNNIASTYETKTDATTKQTDLQTAISAIQTTVNNLVGLEGTNFAGFSVDTTEADALTAIPTKYTTDGYTNELVWYLVGDGIDNLKAYSYDGTNTPVLVSSKVYDFTDFSGVAADISTLRQDLDTLGPKIGDKLDKSQANDTFYVTDEGGNVIAKIDKDGIHSVDFKIGESSVSTLIQALTDSVASEVTSRIAAIQAEETRAKEEEAKKLDHTIDDDKFEVTDGNGYTIFRIDKDGVHAPNITDTINDDKIVITDNRGYVVAQIDKDGVHSAMNKDAVACMVLSEGYYPTSAPTRDSQGNVTHADVKFFSGIEGSIDISYTNGLSSSVAISYGNYDYEMTINRDSQGNVETVEIN